MKIKSKLTKAILLLQKKLPIVVLSDNLTYSNNTQHSVFFLSFKSVPSTTEKDVIEAESIKQQMSSALRQN